MGDVTRQHICGIRCRTTVPEYFYLSFKTRRSSSYKLRVYPLPSSTWAPCWYSKGLWDWEAGGRTWRRARAQHHMMLAQSLKTVNKDQRRIIRKYSKFVIKVNEQAN